MQHCTSLLSNALEREPSTAFKLFQPYPLPLSHTKLSPKNSVCTSHLAPHLVILLFKSHPTQEAGLTATALTHLSILGFSIHSTFCGLLFTPASQQTDSVFKSLTPQYALELAGYWAQRRASFLFN